MKTKKQQQLKQKKQKYNKQYYQKHQEHICEIKKLWDQMHTEQLILYRKQRYQKNKKQMNAHTKRWYKENPKKAEIQYYNRKINNPEKYILVKARASAKKRNLLFSITLKDIYIPKYCPVLGIKLRFTKKGCHDYTPSIDRINNSKGYVPGNVEIISYRANTLKNNATNDEIKKLYKYYKNKKLQ